MKFGNPFKRKTDPKMQEILDARKKATEEKLATAQKIIKMVDDLSVERRCGVLDYLGPERRFTHG